MIVIGSTLEQKWPIHPHIKIEEFDHMFAERVIQIALILHLISRNDDMATFSTDPLDVRIEIEGRQMGQKSRKSQGLRAPQPIAVEPIY
jgi:two-component sensor histidine kinase